MWNESNLRYVELNCFFSYNTRNCSGQAQDALCSEQLLHKRNECMIYQMAPLEGITTYIYRNAYAKYYGGIDQYFTPFISPHKDKTMNGKERKEVDPENNKDIVLIPQILTNSSVDFLKTIQELQDLGYEEVNLNFGCPSATVTTKKKGSGILNDPDILQNFLDEIFEKTQMGISIKTRIGYADADEWEDILSIYQKYPIRQLIIHPRVREDFYKNEPKKEAFQYAIDHYQGNLIYNGNLFSKEAIEACKEQFPTMQGMMLGRGLIANPGLMREVQNMKADIKTLETFHHEILEGYKLTQSGDKNVLYRMKELWFYMEKSFAPMEKYAKQIRKAQKCVEYEAIVREVFRNVPLLSPEERNIHFT